MARRAPSLRLLNRKVHNYLGLFLLLFLWLFSLSGLLLNHSWAFAEFWPQRQETTASRTIERPRATGDVAIARELMAQLGVKGEVNSTERGPEPDRFTFQAGKPGQSFKVEADFASGRASVQETRVNGWGVFRTLHTFTGVKLDEPEKRRDWLLTHVWSFAMDMVAVGFIVLVLTGLYLWLRGPSRRWPGAVALTLGVLACGAWLWGLRLLF